jgi:hypothetical protein
MAYPSSQKAPISTRSGDTTFGSKRPHLRRVPFDEFKQRDPINKRPLLDTFVEESVRDRISEHDLARLAVRKAEA